MVSREGGTGTGAGDGKLGFTCATTSCKVPFEMCIYLDLYIIMGSKYWHLFIHVYHNQLQGAYLSTSISVYGVDTHTMKRTKLPHLSLPPFFPICGPIHLLIRLFKAIRAFHADRFADRCMTCVSVADHVCAGDRPLLHPPARYAHTHLTELS